MSEKFKVDKVELGLSVGLMIIGGALPVFIDDVWGLGPIILGFGGGGLAGILCNWYYYKKRNGNRKKQRESRAITKCKEPRIFCEVLFFVFQLLHHSRLPTRLIIYKWWQNYSLQYNLVLQNRLPIFALNNHYLLGDYIH